MIEKVVFVKKNLDIHIVDDDDKSYTYTDKFIKKIRIHIDTDGYGDKIISLTSFYKNIDEDVPKKYVGEMFKKIITHLIKKKVLKVDDIIKLYSPYLEDFEGTDPKKLLNYYKTLGFELIGSYKMINTHDRFYMEKKIEKIEKKTDKDLLIN